MQLLAELGDVSECGISEDNVSSNTRGECIVDQR